MQCVVCGLTNFVLWVVLCRCGDGACACVFGGRVLALFVSSVLRCHRFSFHYVVAVLVSKQVYPTGPLGFCVVRNCTSGPCGPFTAGIATAAFAECYTGSVASPLPRALSVLPLARRGEFRCRRAEFDDDEF